MMFDNVKAYKVPPPYPVPGGRFWSVVWSDSDKIWSGTFRTRLEKEESYRELVLEGPDSGQFFGHTYIPCHPIDLSVLDSQEHFVIKFSDGAQHLMHLGLQFSASADARKFYRALLCQEGEDGVAETASVENVDDYDVGEGRSIGDKEEEEEGESTQSTGDEEEEGEEKEEEEEEEDGTRMTGKDVVLGQLSEFKKQINSVYEELREKKRELKVKERKLKVKEDTVKNLEAKLKGTESEKVRLREECSAKTLRIRELEKHCNSMIQVLNESSGAFDSMRGSVDSMRGSVDSMRGRVDSMRGRVDSAKTKINEQIDKCKKILSAP